MRRVIGSFTEARMRRLQDKQELDVAVMTERFRTGEACEAAAAADARAAALDAQLAASAAEQTALAREADAVMTAAREKHEAMKARVRAAADESARERAAAAAAADALEACKVLRS